jgi:hypothetical protein
MINTHAFLDLIDVQVQRLVVLMEERDSWLDQPLAKGRVKELLLGCGRGNATEDYTPSDEGRVQIALALQLQQRRGGEGGRKRKQEGVGGVQQKRPKQ